jgi:misacylated tRNA(Ala) deacylase
MAQLLYLGDSYLKEIKAKVVDEKEIEGKKAVVLDRTIFYPTSGGQANDTGKLVVNGEEIEVYDVRKIDNEVFHFVRTNEDLISKEVLCKIDWEKRYMHMRLHSALHLIDGVIVRYFKELNAFITGSAIFDDYARIDFDFEKGTRQLLQMIIDKSNQIAEQGLEIRAKFLPKEEALKNPNLIRTIPGKELIEKLENVRVIEIVGLDEQMDGGTHVKNTKEIGKIVLSSYESKGKHNKRAKITLEKN